MPRIGLNQLLRTLKAAGVRRYVHAGAQTEVEFWAPDGTAPDETAAPVDQELTRDTKRTPAKDPIAAALDDDLLDVGEDVEAN